MVGGENSFIYTKLVVELYAKSLIIPRFIVQYDLSVAGGIQVIFVVRNPPPNQARIVNYLF